LSDGARVVELYTMTGFDHTDDMLLVYLPNKKILAEADAYSPPETPTTPLIAPKVPVGCGNSVCVKLAPVDYSEASWFYLFFTSRSNAGCSSSSC